MVVLTSFVSFTSFPLAKNFATIILFATIFLATSLTPQGTRNNEHLLAASTQRTPRNND